MKYKIFLATLFITLIFAGVCSSRAAYIYQKGDVNLDGKVNTTDVRHILKALASDKYIPELVYESADVDENRVLTIADARILLKEALESSPVFEKDEDTKAVWVATAASDFPKYDNLSATKLKNEIDEIVNTTAENGLNTIFFQVRPYSDALYNSAIFPTSTVLVENQGDIAPLDCLEYFTEAAHAKNIKLQAWINPYRVTSATHSTASLAQTNPAILHPEWTVKHFNTDGSPAGIFYNPALPEVRQLVLDGVAEIINNYNVDGIHFDDYFYPYNNAENFNDTDAYAKYGNEMKIDDWRRNNVNLLIESVHTLVNQKGKEFGISPFGVWAKKTSGCPEGTPLPGWPLQAYSDIYADSKRWVEEHWVDYICPQLYWEQAHKTAPFKPLVDWWDELCAKNGVKLYIGIAAYRGEDPDSCPSYAQPNEIQNQLAYLKTKKAVSGEVYFSYRSIKTNAAGISDTLKAEKSKSELLLNFSEKHSYTSAPQAYEVILDGTEIMEMPGNPPDIDYGPTRHIRAIKGMRLSVAYTKWADDEYGNTQEYAVLDNGLYILKRDIAPVIGEQYHPTTLENVYFSNSKRYSNLVIPCSENVTNTIWLGSNAAEITLYGLANTDISSSQLQNNLLFSNVQIEKINDKTLKIILTYKKSLFIFGFDGIYTNDSLVISFKNPTPISQDASKPLTGIKISLDPGHSRKGGAECSYNGETQYEHLWNLKTAINVKAKLEEMGATVRLTHNGEWEEPLEVVMRKAMAWHPDINISIHFNAVSYSGPSGTNTYWCFGNSALLSNIMLKKSTETDGLKNNSSTRSYYEVSRFCEYPSILFECLYMSTQSDVDWYMKNSDKLEQGIANGILEYFKVQ